MHIAIERARALAYFAALTIAADDPRRRLASAMAKASAGECQSLVFRHGLQLFGAMGFTWENDVQFALKRAKAGELMLGGAAEHRAFIAERRWRERDRAADLRRRRRGLPRTSSSAFLDEHLPDEASTVQRSASTADMPQWARRWQRLHVRPRLAAARQSAGVRRPQRDDPAAVRPPRRAVEAHGSTRASTRRASASSPRRCCPSAPTSRSAAGRCPILRAEDHRGTGHERARRRIGSGVAAHARRCATASHFVVNGQKVWTSGAHDADVILTFVRTDPGRAQAQGHQRAADPDRHRRVWSAGRSPRSAAATISTSTRCSSPTCGCPPRT